jgi:hypothetical protein
LIALTGLLATAVLAAATLPRRFPGFRAVMTDSTAIFRAYRAGPPAYREKGWIEPTFGLPVTRIADDSGRADRGTGVLWGADTRHHYSRDQPWNADESLLMLQNPARSDGQAAGGSPGMILLDGQSYEVLRSGQAPNWDPVDSRWHPSPRYHNVRIGVVHNAARDVDSLMWVDFTPSKNGKVSQIRGWRLPFRPTLIGQGEGNTSNDGRFIGLSEASDQGARIVVIDMDPTGRELAYSSGHRRIGPIYTLPPCSLSIGCKIGNISISPSGRYVDVKYAGRGDFHRILKVDTTTLALRLHNLPASSPRCGTLIDGRPVGPNGWIMGLKHADMALNPFDHNEDVIVGVTRCLRNTEVQGQRIGVITMQRLRDGTVTALTDARGGKEADGLHVSCRNLQRPGWAYVSFDNAPSYAGKRFYDELVAVKLDGSKTVQRFAHQHSEHRTYRSEPQAVPSPDGRRVIWASNWNSDCGPCGFSGAGSEGRRQRTVKAFVVDAR